MLGEVVDVDLAARTVTWETALGSAITAYDSLVVAAGAQQSYFGMDEFSAYAPGSRAHRHRRAARLKGA